MFQGSIIRHVYDTLLQLYEKYPESGSRGRVLQCLGTFPGRTLFLTITRILSLVGFLFRAQPILMTLESTAVIMDDIFASSLDELRARLLKIIQDFLMSEASKHNAKEKEKGKNCFLSNTAVYWPNRVGTVKQQVTSSDDKINMAELVGNTDGFADSGYVSLPCASEWCQLTIQQCQFRSSSAIYWSYIGCSSVSTAPDSDGCSRHSNLYYKARVGAPSPGKSLKINSFSICWTCCPSHSLLLSL